MSFSNCGFPNMEISPSFQRFDGNSQKLNDRSFPTNFNVDKIDQIAPIFRNNKRSLSCAIARANESLAES